MTALTRRSLLLGATALAGTAALSGALAWPPTFAEIMAEKAARADQAAARLPAWVVGTPGDFDGQIIRAATEEDAIAEWLDDMWIQCECGDVLDSGEVIGPEDCYRCTHSVEAERSTYFDDIDNPKAGDWLRAGMGAHCSRCGEETCDEWNGHAIGDEAVCEDCMALEDWRLADPERAAEMEAEDLS